MVTGLLWFEIDDCWRTYIISWIKTVNLSLYRNIIWSAPANNDCQTVVIVTVMVAMIIAVIYDKDGNRSGSMMLVAIKASTTFTWLAYFIDYSSLQFPPLCAVWMLKVCIASKNIFYNKACHLYDGERLMSVKNKCCKRQQGQDNGHFRWRLWCCSNNKIIRLTEMYVLFWLIISRG